jgi:hypothetical protein
MAILGGMMNHEFEQVTDDELSSLKLPKNWSQTVRHTVLNVSGIVRIAMLTGREFLIENGSTHQAKIHRLESEVAILREELRILGSRMNRIPPQRRPQYSPVERMAISPDAVWDSLCSRFGPRPGKLPQHWTPPSKSKMLSPSTSSSIVEASSIATTSRRRDVKIEKSNLALVPLASMAVLP